MESQSFHLDHSSIYLYKLSASRYSKESRDSSLREIGLIKLLFTYIVRHSLSLTLSIALTQVAACNLYYTDMKRVNSRLTWLIKFFDLNHLICIDRIYHVRWIYIVKYNLCMCDFYKTFANHYLTSSKEICFLKIFGSGRSAFQANVLYFMYGDVYNKFFNYMLVCYPVCSKIVPKSVCFHSFFNLETGFRRSNENLFEG